MPAIETIYAGCRFRSRIEARWAVFFDHAGVRWEHEAEGFETPAGRYLPDFTLHLAGRRARTVLFEIKPESQIGTYDPRWSYIEHEFYASFGLPRPNQLVPSDQPGDGQVLLISRGDPVAERDLHGEVAHGWLDNYHAFCVCPWCGAVGIEFDGRGARVCGPQAHDPDNIDDKRYTYDHPTLAAAYTAARSARFEFGERG